MEKLKVIQDFAPDNCAELNVVSIEEMSITYSQGPDTNSPRDEFQHLKITTQNCGTGEDGWYFDIDTCGGHWSVDNPSQITEILEDFKKRFDMNITKVKDLKRYSNEY